MDGSLGMPLGDVSMPSIPWNDISLFPDDLEIPSKGTFLFEFELNHVYNIHPYIHRSVDRYIT
jgi:hypothetical protein